MGVPTIRALQADITSLAVDAIVNAANPSLLGGGGVDGAIHRAAGPELLAACRQLGGCEVGDAKITPGFGLPAGFVIHAVGPVWRGGRHREPVRLAMCYARSLQIAADCELRSIAFPCISTGAYGYPAERAARVAIDAVNASPHAASMDEIVFCCHSPADLEIYRRLLGERRLS